MKEPKVSIIMNCLNGSEYLKEALDSVMMQTYKNWEVIFWDNASTDDSASIAKSYGGKINYFCSDSTIKISIARERAFNEASGEYIAILDVDDIWFPKKLEKQIDVFKKNKNIGVVFCDTMNFDEGGDRFNQFSLVRPFRGKVFGKILRNNFLSSVALVFKREVLFSLDYIYDKRFVAIEDYDLTLRIAMKNQYDFVNEVLCKRRMGSGVSYEPGFKVNFAKEKITMFETYEKNHKTIMDYHRNDVDVVKSVILRHIAFDEWNKGNVKEARSLLLNFKSHFLNWIAYLGTLIFPSYSEFEKFYQKLIFPVRIFLNKLFEKNTFSS